MTDDPRRDGARRAATSSPLLGKTLARAQELVHSKPVGAYSPAWCSEALHVGDMSVLALDSELRAKALPGPRVNSA